MIENKQVKILQYFYIHTERFLEATKPDITAVDKKITKTKNQQKQEMTLN